ncbi:MAG: ABC transporter permease [Ginsengibacter sp.]
MIKNYLKIAWRNLIRNKGFSSLNIMGLALGLTCSLLIMLWVQDELKVDGFHVNGSQLYQVYERKYYDGKVEASYHTQGLLASELKRAIPEVQYASSLEQDAPYPYTFEAGDKRIKLMGSYANVDFFTMFSYPLIYGNSETALSTPNGIAVSRKMAEQFFGSTEKAIGKMIRFENRESLLVTAVFENVPVNSSQQFDFLRCWQDYVQQNAWLNSWGSFSPYTFIQLRKDADPSHVEAKIKDFLQKYTASAKGFHIDLALQPYKQKYLYSTFKNGYIDGGRIEYIRLFSIVAIFVLLIACINFMNLSTARSTKRAKEVGIRKVVGAVRSSLVRQFIGEAWLLTLISAVIAIALVAMLLPAFNSLTGKQVAFPVTQPLFWSSLIGLIIITGLVAGSYPAFFLSSLNPNKILKGSLKFSAAVGFFRRGLVVFQFSLSIILIIAMIVIYRQVNYVQTKNLGYDRQNLLYIPLEGDLIKNYQVFKEAAGKIPGIVAVSKMKESPTVIGHHIGDISWRGKDPNQSISFADATVGYDFIKTMHLKLKEGHDFSRDFGTDSMGYILNEAAVAKIGYKDAIGQPLAWAGQEGKIIGVLEDFHFASLHETIEPLVIRLSENQKWGTILIRTEAGKTKDALSELEKIFKKLNPNYPFTYQFSDQEYAKLYNNEQTVSKLSNYFAILAIFISSLGLFGLATFTAAQRTKEIGVRKVLGATVPTIISLMVVNFLKPVFIAMLIAFPVAWYAMNEWLLDFAYKINIGWWTFVLAGLITIGIAVVTVSFQSIKSALINPVKSLRAE